MADGRFSVLENVCSQTLQRDHSNSTMNRFNKGLQLLREVFNQSISLWGCPRSHVRDTRRHPRGITGCSKWPLLRSQWHRCIVRCFKVACGSLAPIYVSVVDVLACQILPKNPTLYSKKYALKTVMNWFSRRHPVYCWCPRLPETGLYYNTEDAFISAILQQIPPGGKRNDREVCKGAVVRLAHPHSLPETYTCLW